MATKTGKPQTLAEKGEYRMLKGAVHPVHSGTDYNVDSATDECHYRVTVTAQAEYHCQCLGWQHGYAKTGRFGIHCWHCAAVSFYKQAIAKAREQAHGVTQIQTRRRAA